MKEAELVILSECGHMVTLEQPGGTLAAVKRWLQRSDADQKSSLDEPSIQPQAMA